MMMPSTELRLELDSDGLATQDAVSFSYADATSFFDLGFGSLPPHLQDSAASQIEPLDPYYFQIPDVASSLDISIPFGDYTVFTVPEEGVLQGPVMAQRPYFTRPPDDDYSRKMQSSTSQSSFRPIDNSLAAVDPALLRKVSRQSLLPTPTCTDTEIPFQLSSSSSLIERSAPKSFGASPSDYFSETAPSLMPLRLPRGRDKEVIARRRRHPARKFCRVCDGLDFTVKRSLENHIMAEHLGMRFHCPVEGCTNDYRHMTSLGRHIRVDHRGIMDRYMGSVGGD